ncbi:MAG: hypothetical protein P4L64_03575 [Caulobacteraceae bacterium]|nr:hypothetical protein [Caulobacteraceae bacterium]
MITAPQLHHGVGHDHDDWFYYPEPIYPYPTYIAPAPAAPPPQNVWYRCDAPPGFYPYVETCPGGWRTVPAAPSDLNQAPPPPPEPPPR